MPERTRDGLGAASARGRLGWPTPKLRHRPAKLARQKYDQVDEQDRNKWLVGPIAAEHGVSRSTICGYLDQRSSAVEGS